MRKTTIVNVYAPKIAAPQYIRQTLTDIKGEINSNTIIVGEFNTPLTLMDRSSKKKINKTEIISIIFFNHNTMILKINYKKKKNKKHRV